MLELTQLTDQVAGLATALADQQSQLQSLADRARALLHDSAQVTDELRAKLMRAAEVDPSWRGADPLGDRLDETRTLPGNAPAATLLASDGSQIYPDAHGIALYYLLNVGTIVLRQGTGQAPDVHTRCQLFYQERELYDESHRLIEIDKVNARRDLWELQVLAELAWEERRLQLGNLNALLVALGDGPLLLWMPQRLTDTQQAQRVEEFARELGTLRRLQAVPLGYVDRPRSANVLRVLHLLDLSMDQITKETLRRNPYPGLSDRALFGDLKPGERTGFFAATSEINDTYGQAGHRMVFCYANLANASQAAGSGAEQALMVQPRIVRIETPEWVLLDQDAFDAALAAVRWDCRLTGYPYVLSRAHELAVVTRHERAALEQMMSVELRRQRLAVEESGKAAAKRLLGGR